MAASSADSSTWHPATVIGGLVPLAAVLVFPPPGSLGLPAWHTLGVVLTMAVWWFGQAMPIAATALVPLIAFPLMGVGKIGDVSRAYANPIIFLFLGGFFLAKALERWNVHTRIAVTILRRIGTHPAAIVGGMAAASAFLSMWVSNTATTAMMLPIALSVIALLDPAAVGGGGTVQQRNLAIGTTLAIAYGANVGGIATLIGTPTNAILAAYLESERGIHVGFLDWMVVGLPVSLILLGAVWVVLTRIVYPVGRQPIEGARELLAAQAAAIGRPRPNEWRVLTIFGLVTLLWLFRPLIQLALPGLPISDPAISIFGAVLLFLVPAAHEPAPGEADAHPRRALLNWDEAKTVPWGICLLVGGGLALADAMDKSGLAKQLGGYLPGCDALPAIALLFLIVTFVVFLTEVTTNAAITAILLPIVGGLAGCNVQQIALFAAPVAIAAGCAFMMPIATPPNAIVFGSGHITIGQMARAGFVLNLVSIVVVTAVAYLLVPLVF